MILDIIAIIFGLIALVYSADRFIEGAASIAQHSKVSPLIIGLLILGFGTSAPEITVSIFAALDDSPALAFGNAIGSNITNIALVLGVSALIANIKITSSALQKEFPLLLIATAIFGFLTYDLTLSLIDGVVLLLMLAGILYLMLNNQSSNDALNNDINNEIPEMSIKAAWFWSIFGLIFLILSSRILVWGAIKIASALGMSDLVIGLTVVAIGTSLPELAASVIAVLKNKHDMAIGNIIGSNLFNLLAAVGISSIIKPYQIAQIAFVRDYLIMASLTLFLYLILRFGKRQINRVYGIIFSSIFMVYLWALLSNV